MNTIQIERILRRDPYCKKIFKGVYARDQIKRVSYPSAYVINSDPSTRCGKHWIALFFARRENGQYFDSNGLPPKVLGFTVFIYESNFEKVDLEPKNFARTTFCSVWSILHIFCVV